MSKKEAWFSVYLLESPGPLDRMAAGYEEGVLDRALDELGVPGVSREVSDWSEFWVATQHVLPRVMSRVPFQPVLHISAHGNTGGIALRGEIEVPWSWLSSYLQKMNQATQGELAIVLSTCSGFGGALELKRLVNPKAIVGPVCEVGWVASAHHFATFYTVLHKTGSIAKAVAAMNNEIGTDVYAANYLNAGQEALTPLADLDFGGFARSVSHPSVLKKLRDHAYLEMMNAARGILPAGRKR